MRHAAPGQAPIRLPRSSFRGGLCYHPTYRQRLLMDNASLPAPSASVPVKDPFRTGASPAQPLWRAFFFCVLLYAGWILAGAVFQPRLSWFTAPGFDPRPLLLYLCLDAVALSLSAGFLLGLDGGSFSSLGLTFRGGWLAQALAGAAWGAGAMAATAVVLKAEGAAGTLPRGLPGAHDVSLFFFLMLAALFEELAFRGYAFQRASEVLGPTVTAVLSSALFGFAHYGNPRASLLSTLNTVLAGLLLAVARIRSGGLWMPVGLHFCWNLFLGPIFGFPVSGFSFGMARLAGYAAEPVWLTGGAYGPEGGAVLTVVLGAAVVLMTRLPVPQASLRANSGVDYP